MLMLNDFAKEVHANAVAHGWWEEERSFGEIISLCHSELSEALEEFRAGRPMIWQYCIAMNGGPCVREGCGDWKDGICEINAIGDKPEGIAVEMADCVIRILDWCGKENVDVDEAREAGERIREHLLGVDGSLENVDIGDVEAEMHLYLSMAYQSYLWRSSKRTVASRMAICINRIFEWAKAENVDIESVLRLKHEYNLTRPYKHGGKVI